MASHAVDVVAAGPPPVDPYDPGGSVWALAEGLRATGRSVQVLFPSAPRAQHPPAPKDVTAVPVVVPVRRPGSASEPADFARWAGAQVRPEAEVVVRDPVGLGSLGIPRRNGGPSIVGWARALEVAAFDRERQGRPYAGFGDRLDAWRDRRTVRRLERVAVGEADRILYDDREVAGALARAYAVGERRLLELPRAALKGPEPPTREEARGSFGIAADAPVVVAVSAHDAGPASGAERVLEAFKRVRPLFPGARFVVAGATVPTTHGVVSVPTRDLGTFVRALRAADVAVFPSESEGFDPGVVLALRLGIATLAAATVRLGSGSEETFRAVSGPDPGELASSLAELLADPAQRRELGERAVAFAQRFDAENVVAGLENAGVLPRL